MRNESAARRTAAEVIAKARNLLRSAMGLPDLPRESANMTTMGDPKRRKRAGRSCREDCTRRATTMARMCELAKATAAAVVATAEGIANTAAAAGGRGGEECGWLSDAGVHACGVCLQVCTWVAMVEEPAWTLPCG